MKSVPMNKTAKMVAYYRDIESRRPVRDRLFDDIYAKYFVDEEAIEFAHLMAQALPSLYTFLRLRTAIIDKWVKCFLDELNTESSQVVIVGAGADTRSIRMKPERDNVHFYELDYPGNGVVKKQIIGNAMPGMDINHIKFVEIDLMEGHFFKRLSESAQLKATRILFILEGVLNYLTSDAVDSVMSGISRMASAYKNVTVIIHYCKTAFVNKSTQIPELSKHYDALKDHGFPSYFGIDDVEVFARHYGFSVRENYNSTELRKIYNTNTYFNNDAGRFIGLARLEKA